MNSLLFKNLEETAKALLLLVPFFQSFQEPDERSIQATRCSQESKQTPNCLQTPLCVLGKIELLKQGPGVVLHCSKMLTR